MSCLAHLFQTYPAALTAINTELRTYHTANFSSNGGGLVPVRDGFEALYAELLIMLGDEAYTNAFQSRFDLAASSRAAFEGSLFEPNGIDISAVAIAHCRKRLPQAELHTGIAEALPFVDNRFDLVTCMGSLEHFLDQPGALAEMRRVSKSAARYLILVPNAGFLTRRLGLYGGTGRTAVRETVRSIEAWESLLRGAGLRVRERWRDLHPISTHWITLGRPLAWPVRAAQALALATWPLRWQYQIYFYCEG